MSKSKCETCKHMYKIFYAPYKKGYLNFYCAFCLELKQIDNTFYQKELKEKAEKLK